MRRRSRFWLLWGVLCLPLLIAGQRPTQLSKDPKATQSTPKRRIVGQLLSVRGAVMLQHSEKEKPTQVKSMTYVCEGDIVATATGGTSQVVFDEGSRYRLVAPCRVRVVGSRLRCLSGPKPIALPPIDRSLARNAGLPGHVGGTHVRGDGKEYHASPVGAVASDALVLRWDWQTDSKQTLRIKEVEGSQCVIGPLELDAQTRQYAVPTGTLKAGVWYEWSVTTFENGVTNSCVQPLRIVAPEDAAEIVRMEQDAATARQAAPEDATPDVLLAQGYARLGHFDKALAAYQAALRKTPEDAGVKEAMEELPAKADP